ncbi:HNH endonuclease [Pseudidiomarina planktonica]
MWHSANQDEFSQSYNLSTKQAHGLQCTAEHLKAKSDGGGNEHSNIVAACRYCNKKRHQYRKPPSPERYKKLVTDRIAKGKWLPESILCRVQSTLINQ